jgi:hypothetical protein
MGVSRRGLNDNELALLVVFIVASGDWEANGISRIDAFNSLADVCKILAVNDNLDRTAEGFALSCQNALMAFRRDSFEVIQKEPPFQSYAIANLKSLANSWAIGQEAKMLENFTSIFADQRYKETAKPILKIVSGDGKTIDSPVKFSDCTIEIRGKCECWFINYTLGYESQDWYRGSHFTTSRESDGLGISLWEVSLPDGSSRSFYFDTNWV